MTTIKNMDSKALCAEVTGAAVTAAIEILVSRGIMDPAGGMVSLDPPGAAIFSIDSALGNDAGQSDLRVVGKGAGQSDCGDVGKRAGQSDRRDVGKRAGQSDCGDVGKGAGQSDCRDVNEDVVHPYLESLYREKAEAERRLFELNRRLPEDICINFTADLEGFFGYLGDYEAVGILREYFGDSCLYDSKTSLDDLGRAIKVLRETNRQRALRELPPLMVSSIMMAIAAVDADAVLWTGDSPRAYNVSENIGVGDDSPLGWFEEEEKRFLGHLEGSVSRYTAMMARNRSVMGVAVIEKYGIYCQTFDWWASEHSYDGLRKGMMTVEEYSGKVEEFKEIVGKKKLEDRITKLGIEISELENKYEENN